MKFYAGCLLFVGVLCLAPPAHATLLFSDLAVWYGDGTVKMTNLIGGGTTTLRGAGGVAQNGGGLAEQLLLKIEEDVLTYDPVLHPYITPGMDRYVYTITNAGFGSGNVGYMFVDEGGPGPNPGTGTNGVSGFALDTQHAPQISNQGLPPVDVVSNLPWSMASGGGTTSWSLDNPGEGIGAPVAGSPISLGSFYFEVPHGTTHGVTAAWVNSHDANNNAVNYLTGYVTAPVPEPGSLLLLGSGLFAVATLLRRKRGE